MLRVTEHTIVPADAHSAKSPGPWINILKEVPVNCPIMMDAETSDGQRFIGALSRHRGLKLGQCSLSAVTRAIFENGGPWIAVWILNRVVHRLVRTICRISWRWLVGVRPAKHPSYPVGERFLSYQLNS